MPSELHVWGIRNCDTVRAALKWLEARDASHRYHDFRKDGLPEDELRRWIGSAHGPKLVNRRSATWRKLDESQKQQADTDPVPLLLAHPTLIKRPVITDGETVLLLGFSADSLEEFI
jgi:Spx/MgsR family transcriptional regulator